AINASWHKKTLARLAELETRNAEWRSVQRESQTVMAEAGTLKASPPAVLHAADGVGIDTTKVIASWDALASPPPKPDLRQLADHIDSGTAALEITVGEVRKAANAELDRREGAWRPVAAGLATWLAQAD